MDAEPLPGGCTVIVRPDHAANIVKTAITKAIGNTGSAVTGDYGRYLIPAQILCLLILVNGDRHATAGLSILTGGIERVSCSPGWGNTDAGSAHRAWYRGYDEVRGS